MAVTVDKGGLVAREQVWITAWCAVASASNCTGSRYAASWADDCLSEFDKRFAAIQPTDRRTPEQAE